MASIPGQVNKTILHKSTHFVTSLQARGLRIHSAYLYGSHATGWARHDSDIDIAVVSPDLSGDWLDDYCLLTRIADDVDARIEVIPFLPEDFRDHNPLVWEIKTKGIPLLPPSDGRKRKRVASRRATGDSVSRRPVRARK
mgnify:CR=1 FL=1